MPNFFEYFNIKTINIDQLFLCYTCIDIVACFQSLNEILILLSMKYDCRTNGTVCKRLYYYYQRTKLISKP